MNRFTNLTDAKVRRLWEATKDLEGFDHVLMVDSVDTLFTGGLEPLFEQFDAFGHDFVTAGETNDWPPPHPNHPHKGKRFGFLNSGCYLATWPAYRRVMEAMQTSAHQNDQGGDVGRLPLGGRHRS